MTLPICELCEGTGVYQGETCEECRGAGVDSDIPYEVAVGDVPEHVRDFAAAPVADDPRLVMDPDAAALLLLKDIEARILFAPWATADEDVKYLHGDVKRLKRIREYLADRDAYTRKAREGRAA